MVSRMFIILLVSLTLASCGGGSTWQDDPQTHIVRKGETLFSIAWRYGKDPAAVARWNGLGDGSLIYPGQVLRMTPPSGGSQRSASTGTSNRQSLPSIPAQPPPPWGWPTRGKIAVEFGGKPGSGTGVLIDGRPGQAVVAAASGRVVYAGGGLIGYGQLIILKHNDTYLSAYGHNAKLLVKEGQAVRKGQQIATMGSSGTNSVKLHFELRRLGKPVDPLTLLPKR